MGARFAHLGPAARRRQSIRLHLAAAGQQHAEERQDRRVHMKLRQRVGQPFLPFSDRREAAAGGVGSTGGEFIAVRRHAAFRSAGRTRVVTHAGGRLWRDRRAVARLRRGRARQRLCKTLEPGGLRLTSSFGHRRAQRLDAARQRHHHHHQINARRVGRAGPLARASVGVDRHATRSERVHRELVQHVLSATLQQQAGAVAIAVTGLGLARHQCAHLGRCGLEGDSEALRVTAPSSIRRHCQQRAAANSVSPRVAWASIVIMAVRGSRLRKRSRRLAPSRSALAPAARAGKRHACAGAANSWRRPA